MNALFLVCVLLGVGLFVGYLFFALDMTPSDAIDSLDDEE